MRTLVDLLNDDIGYVRIYEDQSGYSYERSTYAAPAIRDLFDQMTGYDSAASAREAASLQLLAAQRMLRGTRRRRR
jgi:hypothetical protein